jgi:hypothetical protein
VIYEAISFLSFEDLVSHETKKASEWWDKKYILPAKCDKI